MDNKIFKFSEVQNDFRFEQIKERLNSATARKQNKPAKSARVLCNTCDENEALFDCETCSEKLCRTCHKGHIKNLKDHVVVGFEEKMRKQRESALVEHKKIEEKIDNFQKAVSQIDMKIHEQWEHVSDVSNELDGFLERVTKLVQEKKDGMVQQVKNLKCQEKLNTSLEKVAIARAEAASLKDLIAKNPTEALQVMTECSQNLDNSLVEPQCTFLKFKIGFSDQSEYT